MRHVLKKSIDAVVSEKIEKLFSEKNLLSGVKRLGLAVSGGSDSIALLYIMAGICRKRGIVPLVLHFDHSLRGEASCQDAQFVRDTARSLGVEFITEKASGISQGYGKSLEMAAREARQAFFRRAMASHAIDAIATGHQADDVAETLIMRLLRGAGAEGLSGLKPKSTIAAPKDGGPEIRLIRPLLRLRRDELRAWLAKNGRVWREDATNDDTTIARNNVRHDVIPFLCKTSGRNSDPVKALARTAEILREDDDCLDAISRQILTTLRPQGKQHALDIATLKATSHIAIQRRVLRLWLMDNASPEASGFDTVGQILSAESGVLPLAGNLRVRISAGILSVLPKETTAEISPAVEMRIGESATFGAFSISAEYSRELIRVNESFSDEETSCTVSATRLSGRPLTIRTRQPGDRMTPYGMDGSKKIKDIFIDAKLPESHRAARPVVLCGDEIVWLPGYRIAAPYAAKEGEETVKLKCVRIRD